MYIEHLVLPLPENNEVYKGAFRLWSVSDDSDTNISCAQLTTPFFKFSDVEQTVHKFQ